MDITTYTIGKFAELSGIPVRTLHYYEEVGLLHPRRQTSGHRIYGTADLITLQKMKNIISRRVHFQWEFLNTSYLLSLFLSGSILFGQVPYFVR